MPNRNDKVALHGDALRAELKRLLDAPVRELPDPDDGMMREKIAAAAKAGRATQGPNMALDFRVNAKRYREHGPSRRLPSGGKYK